MPDLNPSSIQTDITRIHSEKTDAYVFAACINVYYEVLRRKRGRVVFGPGDVDRLLTITTMFLDIDQVENTIPDARPHEPTPDERAQILAVADAIESDQPATTVDLKARRRMT